MSVMLLLTFLKKKPDRGEREKSTIALVIHSLQTRNKRKGMIKLTISISKNFASLTKRNHFRPVAPASFFVEKKLSISI